MQFDSIILEVDGSLDNPMAVAAVTIWSLVLSAFSSVIVGKWVGMRDGSTRPADQESRLRLPLILLFLFVATPFAQHSIGTMLYQLEAFLSGGQSIMSVGFWGGPSVLPAWIVAVVTGGFAFKRRRAVP